jgi:hypothetical protein
MIGFLLRRLFISILLNFIKNSISPNFLREYPDFFVSPETFELPFYFTRKILFCKAFFSAKTIRAALAFI